MSNEAPFFHKFIQENFTYNDEHYSVVMSPEMYRDEEGLDGTGNYVGILINPSYGTFPFKLIPRRPGKWELHALEVIEKELSEEIEPDEEQAITDEIPAEQMERAIAEESQLDPNLLVTEEGLIFETGGQDPGIIKCFNDILEKYNKGEK
ncbi:hypothetical protein [Segetibacter aerophilus]|uniref:Uncharacterized protein n=1 Tax=Segetibacter aerophilus TaxID=670293 RepID=A0A512B9V1_9BACT|nr:hypothetical protein [Segetibacter aerophilus]GEO08740.1 hypothetical protein SAE01_12360 [Segetibacter aerophilus]